MKIGFVTNKPYATCETFIKAQVDHLPFKIVHYFGEQLPLSRDGFPPSREANIIRRLYNRFFNQSIGIKKNIQLFKEDEIDLVLAQYGMVGSMLTDVCKKLNLPLVVHFHGHDAVRHSVITEHKDAYLEMFSYATKIISVSHVMTSKLVEIGCPKEKIIYNTYGPSDLFLTIEPKFSQRQIVAVGRFVEKKAPHLLILCFKQVLERFPDMRLILAGDGILLPSCKELVNKLGIEKSVEFPGVISPEQFRKYLSESLIFVQHSVTAQDGDMEGTPVAILEASGAGLPIVSTRHAGIPDVIIEGETGFLVEEKDNGSMADQIIFLLNNLDSAQKMGSNGKQNIVENFSFHRHINGLASILKSASNQ